MSESINPYASPRSDLAPALATPATVEAQDEFELCGAPTCEDFTRAMHAVKLSRIVGPTKNSVAVGVVFSITISAFFGIAAWSASSTPNVLFLVLATFMAGLAIYSIYEYQSKRLACEAMAREGRGPFALRSGYSSPQEVVRHASTGKIQEALRYAWRDAVRVAETRGTLTIGFCLPSEPRLTHFQVFSAGCFREEREWEQFRAFIDRRLLDGRQHCAECKKLHAVEEMKPIPWVIKMFWPPSFYTARYHPERMRRLCARCWRSSAIQTVVLLIAFGALIVFGWFLGGIQRIQDL